MITTWIHWNHYKYTNSCFTSNVGLFEVGILQFSYSISTSHFCLTCYPTTFYLQFNLDKITGDIWIQQHIPYPKVLGLVMRTNSLD